VNREQSRLAHELPLAPSVRLRLRSAWRSEYRHPERSRRV